MESESEQGKRETLADIVAEMRRGTKLPGFWRSCDLNEILKYHADHIETAWKRQMSQSWHHREMEELIAEHEKEVAELKKQTGNAAAMREALEELVKFTCNSCERRLCEEDAEEEDGRRFPSFCSVIINARNALSAPARNCDRFADAESARQAWLYDADNWDEFGSPKLELHEWLLAPAAERKGGDDGR